MRFLFCKVPGTLPALLVAASTGFVSPLVAQSADARGAAREQPLGGRSMALGGADVALPDPETVAANPALLLLARGVAASAQRHRGTGDAGAVAMVTAVGPVTFGLVARHATAGHGGGPIGRPTWSGDAADDHGGEGPATTALTLSAARTVKGQRVGVGVTYATDGAHAKPGTLSLDIGYQRPLLMGLLGVSVTTLDPTGEHLHLGEGPRPRSTHQHAPEEAAADGHAHDHGVAPDLRVAAGWFATRSVHAAWDVGGGVQANLWGDGALQPIASTELSYVPIQGVALTLRSGIRTPRGATQGIFTAGLGASLDHLAVDYAVAPLRDGGGAVHRIGLRIR